MKTAILLWATPFIVCSANPDGFEGLQEVEVASEILSADDIDLTSIIARYSATRGIWSIEGQLNSLQFAETYRPVLFGTVENLEEETIQANFNLSRDFGDEWKGNLSLSAYDGFSDYRSVWISEYYRQLYGAFDAYESPSPNGFGIGTSAEWNYIPGVGTATFSLNFGQDEIAPGWEFNPANGSPEPGRDLLNTFSGAVRLEHALAPWLKTEAAISARDVSDRKARYGIDHSWVATAGPVGFRLGAGYSRESTTFDSTYVNGIVDWEFLRNWSVYLGIRYYNDSGEIQSSGFNAQAPPVYTSELFTGLRWSKDNLSISTGIGWLDTNYKPLSEDNQFFGNLYTDRDWLTFRFGASYQF